jgi:hypothetical protein
MARRARPLTLQDLTRTPPPPDEEADLLEEFARKFESYCEDPDTAKRLWALAVEARQESQSRRK